MVIKQDFLGKKISLKILFNVKKNKTSFSSPHLIEARERIRINGELISKEKFVEYFWICYNTINNAAKQSTDEVIKCVKFHFSSKVFYFLGSNSITILFCISNDDDVLCICSWKGLEKMKLLCLILINFPFIGWCCYCWSWYWWWIWLY